jgi:hypothetical protein
MHARRRLPPVMLPAALASAGLVLLVVGVLPGSGGRLFGVAATAPPSAEDGVGAHVRVWPSGATASVQPTQFGPTGEPTLTVAPTQHGPTVEPVIPTATSAATSARSTGTAGPRRDPRGDGAGVVGRTATPERPRVIMDGRWRCSPAARRPPPPASFLRVSVRCVSALPSPHRNRDHLPAHDDPGGGLAEGPGDTVLVRVHVIASPVRGVTLGGWSGSTAPLGSAVGECAAAFTHTMAAR